MTHSARLLRAEVVVTGPFVVPSSFERNPIRAP